MWFSSVVFPAPRKPLRIVIGTPGLAGAVIMRKEPFVSCWQQSVNGAGQLYIQAAEAAEIMGGQVD